jgi:aryl-alcohol dehydrogenase-like predicted oxidoreductase
MDSKMNRREFLKLGGAVAVGAVALGDSAPAAEPVRVGGRSTKLPQRVLGRTGESVSIIGLGGAGFMMEAERDEDAAAVVNEALDLGITYFDTGHGYGSNQLCERRLGMVMETRRKEAFLATKTDARNYDGVMKHIEESLKTLRTDHVDLLQLHYWPCRGRDTDCPWSQLGGPKGLVAALAKLKEQGLIKYSGLTGHPLAEFSIRDDTRRAIARYDFDTVMCFINPKRESQWVNRELIPVARRKDMGVIAMKMYGGGTPGALVGKKPGQASAKELFRYALSQPIHVAIAGVASIDHVRTNAAWAKEFKPLSTQEAKALVARVNVATKQS